MERISFSKPFITENETAYINKAIQSGLTCGNHTYTKLCHQYFTESIILSTGG